MSDLSVVVLAAGQGKRMYSDLPKVLHPLGGRPLLSHVVATALELDPARVVVVYGHGGRVVPERLARLQAWCAEAEASGVRALQDYAARLRGYALVQA